MRDNKEGTSINLERLQTSGSLFLRGSLSSGIVNVSATKIEIALDCRGAKILSGSDRAFHAEKTNVGTHASLDGGFSCGHADFLGATVGSGLRCRASSIRKLDLRYANISAHFEWADMDNPKESQIDLRDATVGSIKDDVQSWPREGKLPIFVSLDDQIARISRMKASIFFVIRVRSGPRFCSRQIPLKNVTIKPARESLSSRDPRAAARLSMSS